jgi:hypothetical protein
VVNDAESILVFDREIDASRHQLCALPRENWHLAPNASLWPCPFEVLVQTVARTEDVGGADFMGMPAREDGLGAGQTRLPI